MGRNGNREQNSMGIEEKGSTQQVCSQSMESTQGSNRVYFDVLSVHLLLVSWRRMLLSQLYITAALTSPYIPSLFFSCFDLLRGTLFCRLCQCKRISLVSWTVSFHQTVAVNLNTKLINFQHYVLLQSQQGQKTIDSLGTTDTLQYSLLQRSSDSSR